MKAQLEVIDYELLNGDGDTIHWSWHLSYRISIELLTHPKRSTRQWQQKSVRFRARSFNRGLGLCMSSLTLDLLLAYFVLLSLQQLRLQAEARCRLLCLDGRHRLWADGFPTSLQVCWGWLTHPDAEVCSWAPFMRGARISLLEPQWFFLTPESLETCPWKPWRDPFRGQFPLEPLEASCPLLMPLPSS